MRTLELMYGSNALIFNLHPHAQLLRTKIPAGEGGRMEISILVTVPDGGKKQAKTGVMLAYKHDFACFFTSDEHPMLLVRLCRARR